MDNLRSAPVRVYEAVEQDLAATHLPRIEMAYNRAVVGRDVDDKAARRAGDGSVYD